MQRLTRMLRRDKNHACVVGWSLGNESGYGPVTHEAMAAWVRKHEPSRPVQYESCGGAPCTDILCPMYPPLRDVPKLSSSVAAQCAPSMHFAVAPTRIWPRHTHTKELRPFITCEYAHAMGSAAGGQGMCVGLGASGERARGPTRRVPRCTPPGHPASHH